VQDAEKSPRLVEVARERLLTLQAGEDLACSDFIFMTFYEF
jgi:hypothetical protein